MTDLSPSEIAQLQHLKLVGDNPSYTGLWRKTECERLTALGFARQHVTYEGMYEITPEGRAALARLDA
jgi:hypothetical protein